MLRKPYIYIIILTLIDVMCTGIGINGGFITEGNPLLRGLYQFPAIAGIAIVILTVFFLKLVEVVESWLKIQGKGGWICPVLWVVVAIKVGVIICHLYWITLALKGAL
jgi:hypothetical protein